MFSLKFNTGNPAFADDPEHHEVRRILREITMRLLDGATSGAVLDGNGNSIGAWSLSGED